MLPHLKRCVASVSDQGFAFEHIVIDGGSTDGTQEWLLQNPHIVSVSEKDRGMYNALNKAIDKSRGSIIGHLNCDEQYLPGVLQYVTNFFDQHPDVDFLAGDFIVVDQNGDFVAFRKTFTPRWVYFFSNYLYTTTCVLFYRKRVFSNIRFDESYRSIADVIFVYNVLKNGFKGRHVKKYFSTFAYSGDNLSLQPISQVEKVRFYKTLPLWYRLLTPLFFTLFFLEKFIWGNYNEARSLSYSIFRGAHVAHRVTVVKKNPGFRLKFTASSRKG
jgi:glycosyltransferase involved in cell wall biosynthesis